MENQLPLIRRKSCKAYLPDPIVLLGKILHQLQCSVCYSNIYHSSQKRLENIHEANSNVLFSKVQNALVSPGNEDVTDGNNQTKDCKPREELNRRPGSNHQREETAGFECKRRFPRVSQINSQRIEKHRADTCENRANFPVLFREQRLTGHADSAVFGGHSQQFDYRNQQCEHGKQRCKVQKLSPRENHPALVCIRYGNIAMKSLIHIVNNET